MPLFLAAADVHELPAWIRAHAAAERVVVVPTAAAALPDRDAVVDVVTGPLEADGIRPTLVEVGRGDGRRHDGDAAARLAHASAVVVGGGDPFALLAALRRCGGDSVLRRLVAHGVPYAGLSAGAMVAGPDLAPVALTSPFSPPAGLDLTGLGLVDAVVLPHHDRPGRAARHHEAAVRHGRDVHLVPLRDDEVLLDDGHRRVRLRDGTELRDAVEADAADLADVYVAAARAAWPPFAGADRLVSLSTPVARWVDRVVALRAAGTFRVAVDGDGVCAFAATRPAEDPDLGPEVGELALFYAHPRTWGSGVARRLHERAVVDLCAEGSRTAVVWSEERNDRVLHVYAREGWEPDGAVRDRSLLGVAIRELRLRRHLAGAGDERARR